MIRYAAAFLVACNILIGGAFAQGQQANDTLRLNITQADSLFLQQNFMLLASQYQVNASKALVQQARLWDNPTLGAEINLYNPAKQRYFDAGPTGQKIVTIQQLIYLAGKRNKRILEAKNNVLQSDYAFYDLMRTLKFELHSNLFELYYLQQSIQVFEQQHNTLSSTVNAFETQYDKGNTSLRELIRLKALYHQLGNSTRDLQFRAADVQKNLQTLLGSSAIIIVTPGNREINRYSSLQATYSDLLKQGIENRYDLKISEAQVDQAKINLQLQRAMAVPDITIGGTYDQAGSYVNNYTGVSVNIDLPVWNRNQGQIKAASAQVQSQQNLYQLKQLQVGTEIKSALQKIANADSLVLPDDSAFNQQFDLLISGVNENFRKQNLSLLEFTDFFESYTEHIQLENELRLSRIQAFEELNYAVGTELFK